MNQPKPRPEWIGIAMVYPDGQVIAVQIDGEDLVNVPSLTTLTDDDREVDLFANPRSWARSLGARLAFDTRRLHAWYVGEAYARARQRRELDPREITG